MNNPYAEQKERPKGLFWLIVFSLLALVIFINGISLVPPQQYQKLSQNPFITRSDIAEDNYWQENLLLPIIAFYTQQSSQRSFNALCFLIIIAAYLLFAHLSYARFGFIPAVVLSAVLITSPLTTILLSWLGTPDGLTFLLTIPLLFTNSTAMIFSLSVLGVTNHIVFMIAALEILILRWAAKEKISYLQIFAQLAGSTIGYLMIHYFVHRHNIQMMSRLDFMFSKSLAAWLEINSRNPTLTILSYFSLQWLFILISTALFIRREPRFFLITWGLLLLNFGITFFTLDQTRIFSLLSWGILMLCLFRSYSLSQDSIDNDTRNKRVFREGVAVVITLSILLPRYYSWEGNMYLAPFWAFFIGMIK